MADMTLLGFIEHLALFPTRLNEHMHAAMDRAAAAVQREAVREVGSYQQGAGPFVDWAELADATKDDRVRQGFTENDPGLRTGEMRDSIERRVAHDGSQAAIGSDNEKLVYFELGTARQPPRSVLGLAAARMERRVVHELGAAAYTSLAGRATPHPLLPIRPR